MLNNIVTLYCEQSDSPRCCAASLPTLPESEAEMHATVMQLVPDDLKDEKSMVPGQVFNMKKGDDVRLPDGCNCVTIGLGPAGQNLCCSFFQLRIYSRSCEDPHRCSWLHLHITVIERRLLVICQAGIARKHSTWTHLLWLCEMSTEMACRMSSMFAGTRNWSSTTVGNVQFTSECHAPVVAYQTEATGFLVC